MTEMHTNPFEGWTQWRVGCHWSRTTPGGQKVTLSTWQCGGESGYSLTVDFDRVQYNSLGEALAAYDALVAAEEWYAQVADSSERSAMKQPLFDVVISVSGAVTAFMKGTEA